MRRLSLFLLLATAAAPALAAIDEDDDRAARRAERRAAAAAAATEQADSQPQREQRAPRAEREPSSNQGFAGRVREVRSGDAAEQDAQPSEDNDAVRSARSAGRLRDRSPEAATEGQPQSSGGLAPRVRRIRTIPDTQPTATAPTDTQRSGFEGRQRRDYRDGNYQRWSNNWRRDRRYDWRDYRNRHRSRFHLGFYYDPFGWSYRRFNIGWRLWPSHYGSRYWLNDPWQYRLPRAYGPYRWVRYWDDALLVNIYTGEVVDVIHHFFW